jgi:tetratricopeptide (TPR) repeat protein
MGGMNLDNVERLNQLSKEIFYFFTKNFENDKIIPVLNWMINTYSNSSVLLSMAGSWFESVGDYDRSLELYTDSVRYRSSNVEGHMGMARVFESKGEPGSAIVSYERALALDNENPVIYRSLIRLYRSMGDLNKLTDRWMILYRNQPENSVLREHLIEALHRADRFEEARALTSGY